jgi:hypothetical protein
MADLRSGDLQCGRFWSGFDVIRLRFVLDVGEGLDGSSQQTNIDRPAWGAITSVGQLPPLPTEFKGPLIEVRINFLTNRSLPASAVPQPAIP